MQNNINLLAQRLLEEPATYYRTWTLAGSTYAMVANYLLRFDAYLPDNKLSTMKAWVDQNRDKWYGFMPASEESYNYVLATAQGRSAKGLDHFAYSQEVKTPSFFLAMGFSNYREFCAFGAFICAWVYKTTGSVIAQTKGLALLNLYIQPNGSSVWDEEEKGLLVTPKKIDKNFVDKLIPYTLSVYQNYIGEIWSSRTERIENIANQLMIDAEDTVNLSMQTNEYHEEEKDIFNWDEYFKGLKKIGIYTAIGVLGIVVVDKIFD